MVALGTSLELLHLPIDGLGTLYVFSGRRPWGTGLYPFALWYRFAPNVGVNVLLVIHPNVLVFCCRCNKLAQIWLKKLSFHSLGGQKSKVSLTGLQSVDRLGFFCRLWRKVYFPVFSRSWHSPTFLGMWPFIHHQSQWCSTLHSLSPDSDWHSCPIS